MLTTSRRDLHRAVWPESFACLGASIWNSCFDSFWVCGHSLCEWTELIDVSALALSTPFVEWESTSETADKLQSTHERLQAEAVKDGK